MSARLRGGILGNMDTKLSRPISDISGNDWVHRIAVVKNQSTALSNPVDYQELYHDMQKQHESLRDEFSLLQNKSRDMANMMSAIFLDYQQIQTTLSLKDQEISRLQSRLDSMRKEVDYWKYAAHSQFQRRGVVRTDNSSSTIKNHLSCSFSLHHENDDNSLVSALESGDEDYSNSTTCGTTSLCDFGSKPIYECHEYLFNDDCNVSSPESLISMKASCSFMSKRKESNSVSGLRNAFAMEQSSATQNHDIVHDEWLKIHLKNLEIATQNMTQLLAESEERELLYMQEASKLKARVTELEGVVEGLRNYHPQMVSFQEANSSNNSFVEKLRSSSDDVSSLINALKVTTINNGVSYSSGHKSGQSSI